MKETEEEWGEFIVELEDGVFLLNVRTSDPGRTCRKSNAQVFGHREDAEDGLSEARTFHPFKDAKVIDVYGKTPLKDD